MRELNRPNRFLICSALLLTTLVSAASGQYPTSTIHKRDNEKADLYARFQDAKKVSTPEHQRVAYELAEEYLKQFGNDRDKYAVAVRNYVNAYEKALRGFELNSLFSAKNYKKVLDDGAKLLQTDSDNYLVLSLMAQAGYEMSVAGDTSHNKEVLEYSRRALKLLEEGDVKKPDPFKDVDSAKGFLNFAMGWLVRKDSPAEAALALRNAVRTESPLRSDPGVYHLLGSMIIKGEFEPKALEYNTAFGNKPASPEQRAALDALMKIGERAVDAYARAVALSSKSEQQEMRTKMLAQLTILYKSFHNNSDAGLTELIATVLTKPLP